MPIPSPCYLLAQSETVSSQTISLYWTITRSQIPKLMKKWSKRHYSLSDFQAHEQRTRRGPNSLSGFQAH